MFLACLYAQVCSFFLDSFMSQTPRKFEDEQSGGVDEVHWLSPQTASTLLIW